MDSEYRYRLFDRVGDCLGYWYICPHCVAPEDERFQGTFGFTRFKTEDKETFKAHRGTKEHCEKEEEDKRARKEVAPQSKLSGRFKCETCNVSFFKQCQLTRHCKSKQHTGEARGPVGRPKDETYRCETCDYDAPCKYKYDAHLATDRHIKKINGGVFTCTHCPYTSPHKGTFNRHLALHED